MPDDCGHLEQRYFENILRNMQMNLKSYVKYTKVCPYCRTDPKKDTCVNCGASQIEKKGGGE
jgi:rRNA maturation endonuclease Nob1